ncbi:MAG: hypothetical protein AYP45_09560 [Candidatus Brocadia carolinensis]|uniref:Uncharacterized protein n=1 Tax=Candidatus Brocadia carolinensis TaxID=1004156 RepID=A0A1V4AT20_9BACT|nr:MAG: hypothetical protein AYP45_09560 [Candidatus Brocadia caroliniensis]
MKTSVKIAIISAIGAVLAAVIPVVISIVIKKNGDPEKPDISVKESKNVVIGNITTHEGDVIIEGTKTTNTQALSESQNYGTKQQNEH